jgi:hypothetical protein
MASTNPRNQGRPGPGDFTGRQKAAANKEALLADQERAAENLVVAQEDTEDREFGVFDAQTGQRVDNRVAIEVEDDEQGEEQPAAFFSFPGGEAEKVFTGKESPEEIAPALAARKTFTRPPMERAHSAVVRIRVDQDIEDMTFGMLNGTPNNYSFKEGFQYDVPYPLAEHLNDLGLIRQFVRG